ncbi:MAG: flavohemoglobin expression-modulating QEGLA motif protein [Pseudoalteromonas sp.]|uniref:flavohemoglobin expression-modulating QEGLA motif protein n=1 Tax=Pseudoalteromonas sp. TaxID=53249 RepID=UPI0025F0789B|nr:flavohemoglobin expression-modulating QEGLA motif protein [Pseudoalteromonas sp.]MCH2086087.1 flavohemoglobin expression-modulating QEGLA motif protein [Pseudoalteromonas sp.]
MIDKALLAKTRELSDRLIALQTPIRILDAINWDKQIKEEFFKHKCQKNPTVDQTYYQQRDLGFVPSELRRAFSDLNRDIISQLGQLNPIAQYMSKMCTEYKTVLSMIEYRGTPEFHDLSVELFGHPKDLFHAGEPSLSELATMLEQPLKSMLDADILPDDPKNIDAEDAVKILASQVAQTMSGIDVEVILSDGIVSDAAAGANNIKLNQDVKFSQRELDILEVHEGWIHVGTTQNGLAQPYLTCLSKGTPSSTVTQEGLAVLTEIITLKSTPRRLAKLVNRIQGITKVIDGAEFVDIYRDYVAQGLSKDESYTLTQRVFRGSTATGLPFTKDIAYIKGFVLVYNLIRVAIQLGRIDQLHLLLVGKISIDDFRLISQLHDLGVIEDPKFIPPHFKDLRGLATWLSFGRFIGNLSFEQLENDYKPLFL